MIHGASTRMRIAQIAPLYESVPPLNYGGTERVVSFLTEELVRLGHDVTLFASGDSTTQAELIAVCPRSLRTHGGCVDQLACISRCWSKSPSRPSGLTCCIFT